jgi:hypothetical protein
VDSLNFTTPLAVTPNFDLREEAFQNAFNKIFTSGVNVLTVNGSVLLINGSALALSSSPSEIQKSIDDLINYGSPHLGSPAVVERFSKQDSLAALRRPETGDTLMRIIYASWSSLPSRRGLGFLEFVLNMLWPNLWTINRLFHSVRYIDNYPRFVTYVDDETTFPTSRIRVSFSRSLPTAEISELAPVLRRLVPANVVPSIAIEDTEFTLPIGKSAVAMTAYRVIDYSPFA